MNTPARLITTMGTVACLAIAACKPTVKETKDRVAAALMTAVQPDADNINAAQKYYDARPDLKNITPEQRQSLILGCAKLRRLEEGLKNDTISLKDFISQIIGSHTQIITDDNTKLKVSHNIGRPVSNIHFGDQEWEIWTDDQSPNRIFKNPTITSVELQGGSLNVVVEGDECDLQAPNGKYDVFSRIE